jgi:hypothetical protein
MTLLSHQLFNVRAPIERRGEWRRVSFEVPAASDGVDRVLIGRDAAGPWRIDVFERQNQTIARSPYVNDHPARNGRASAARGRLQN